MRKTSKANMKNLFIVALVFLFTVFLTVIALSVVVRLEEKLNDMATQTTNKLLTTPVAMSDSQ